MTRLVEQSPASGLCRSVVAQALAGPVVELGGDAIEVRLAPLTEIGSFWKVLPQKLVRVFVHPSLPRRVRVGEVDAEPGRSLDPAVLEHLIALVPG